MPSIVKAITALAKKEVLVGIPDSAPARANSPISNAQLGRIQEKTRPFLIPGVNEGMPRIIQRLKAGGQQALSGNQQAAQNSLVAAGIIGADAVRAKIVHGPFKPLAESTLAARRARGFKGTKPLIVTGKMRDSITSVIRDKK